CSQLDEAGLGRASEGESGNHPAGSVLVRGNGAGHIIVRYVVQSKGRKVPAIGGAGHNGASVTFLGFPHPRQTNFTIARSARPTVGELSGTGLTIGTATSPGTSAGPRAST